MTQEDRVQYKFMIPVGLKSRIEDAARKNRRSVSAEIVGTLEEQYPEPVSPFEEVTDAIAASLLYIPDEKRAPFLHAFLEVLPPDETTKAKILEQLQRSVYTVRAIEASADEED